MGDVILIRTTADARRFRSEHRRALAAVARTNAEVARILERRRRRDRRRRLLERGSAAALIFTFWFGLLLGMLRWPYAAVVAIAITTVLCALLAAFDPGRRR
jgi:uncharacterized membrane protein (DUF4010 family)